MTIVKCKHCGKKNSDKETRCPKCKRRTVVVQNNLMKNVMKVLPNILYILVQVFLIYLVVVLSEEFLYSEAINDLFIMLGISLLLLINSFIMFKKIFTSKKNTIINGILWCVVIVSIGCGFIYLGRGINAFRYDNSSEVLMLAEKYELKDAKNLKQRIEKIFEYDYEHVSSRDVIIGNFYNNGDVYILYLDDLYENYRLKFYLELEKDEIKTVYWVYDDRKFYLVEDGKKTENFEYYYAMNIFSSVRDNEVNGLATIEEDVEKIISSKFDDSANSIFTYDELVYHERDNSFSLECEVHNMDYYGNGEDLEFKIEFFYKEQPNDKKVWYYGDSSFDYVNWNVKMK